MAYMSPNSYNSKFSSRETADIVKNQDSKAAGNVGNSQNKAFYKY